MATSAELKEKHKYALNILLSVKKDISPQVIPSLERYIRDVVAIMEADDVEWVEKIVGIKAV